MPKLASSKLELEVSGCTSSVAEVMTGIHVFRNSYVDSNSPRYPDSPVIERKLHLDRAQIRINSTG